MDNERVRVLLIEDDEDDYVLTRHLLDKIEAPHFDVTWVDTYDGGLEAAARNKHDVVLVDYRLGAQTGVALIREALERGCRSPIIILTGQADHEADMAAMEAGAADYLEKGGLTARLLERSIRYALERRRAEEALRESEDRFRATFEQLTVGMAHVAPSGHWLRVNPKLCEILGYSVEELRERTWQEMTYPDDLEADVSRAKQVVAGELGAYSMEKRFIRMDGTPIWTHLTTSLVRDRAGDVKYGVAIIEDIASRKQIEATLRESEARFRAMTDSSPLGIFLTDPDGRCIYTNHNYQALTGLSNEEALGNGWSTAIYLEDRDRVFREWYESAERQTSYESIHRYARRDGSLIWVSVKAAAVRDGEKLLGYVGTAEDITGRLAVEAALEQERTLLRTLIDSIPDYIYVKDTGSRFITVNRAGWQGFNLASVEELIGKTDFDFLPHEVAAEHRANEAKIMQTGEALIGQEEQTYERRLEAYRWLITSKVPLRDGQGKIIGLVGISRDITEQKRAEEERIELELQRAQVDVLKRFIGDASHDLRTPLTIMISSLYLLRKTTNPEKQKRYLDNLDEQVVHIQKLVEDLFTLSRLDMPASEFSFAPGDLNQVVQDVVHQQTALAARKQHQMMLALQPDLPQVALAPAEFMVAVRHLMVNALNYTPDGGQIMLTTRHEDGQVVLEVRDNGIGIGVDDLPLIFERFYRVDKVRNIETGGSGLGLTITRKIIEVHGGRIEVESTPGVGSTFRVALPLIN